MNQFNPAFQMQLEQARRLKRAEEARRMNQMPIESPFMRGVQKGATYGMADEIGGAMHGPARRDAIRALDEKASREAPWSMMGGEVAGELASLLVPGGLFAKGAGAIAPGALGTAKKIALGAGLGGLSEGTRGFAEGEGGFLPRTGPANTGAMIGAVVGGALPAAGPLYRATKKGGNQVLKGPLGRFAADASGSTGPVDPSRRKFMKQGGAATALATLAAGGGLAGAAVTKKAAKKAAVKAINPKGFGAVRGMFSRYAGGPVREYLTEGRGENVEELFGEWVEDAARESGENADVVRRLDQLDAVPQNQRDDAFYVARDELRDQLPMNKSLVNEIVADASAMAEDMEEFGMDASQMEAFMDELEEFAKGLD